jgi:hypothetical protein
MPHACLDAKNEGGRNPQTSLTSAVKRIAWFIGGCCWIGFAAISGLFLYAYLTGGAGLQVLGFYFGISSGTILIGLVHFVGFSFIAFACFAIGTVLCARGMVAAKAAP